jgi:FKBP-type peptidyl-prolyl cis-trans isomerase
MRHFGLLLGTFVLSACLNLNVDAPVERPSDPTTETFAASLQVDLSSMQRTAGGVYYKDLKTGTGATLTTQPTIIVNYAAFVTNGTRFGQGNGTALTLSQTIIGLQDGLKGMREGGERQLVIPSALGYGSSPNAPVPANSTLIFDVVLVSIP